MGTRPAPIADGATEAFWAAARARSLLLQRNPLTGVFQWYPRAHCLGDLRLAPEWVQSAGRGAVLTYSVIHQGYAKVLPLPYVLAIVHLDEDVNLLSNVVGCAPGDVHAGMRVRVAFERVSDDLAIPVFEPEVP